MDFKGDRSGKTQTQGWLSLERGNVNKSSVFRSIASRLERNQFCTGGKLAFELSILRKGIKNILKKKS